MAELKTRATEVDVDTFLDAVPDPQRREDGKKLRAMMERISGAPARMWGPTMIGCGRYRYRYESGHGGEMARIAFAPRGRELVVYINDELLSDASRMSRLGRHRKGKVCLYIRRLSDVDEAVLEGLVTESLARNREKYPEGEPGPSAFISASR